MPDSNQVVRYGREEMIQHEGTAGAAVNAGYLVQVSGGTVTHHATAAGVMDRVLVAKDARDRGMELGDAYATGDDAVKYLACSGGGVHLYIAAGATVTSGTRLVSAGNGMVRAFDGVAGDTAAAVVAVADEDVDNSAGTDPAPIAVEVAN